MGKYLKYALGEIILVMVGILLALQVSNWNQKQAAKDKEQLLLGALHEEFVENRMQLDTVVSYHQKALTATQYMVSQFPIDPETINLDTLYTRTFGWAYRFTFNPSQGVIRSLVNTSSFEIIRNEELRALLVSWEDVLADYQEEEIVAASNLRNNHAPEILKNVSFIGFKDKRFDKNYLASIPFENIFYARENNLNDIFGTVAGAGELERIRNTIDRIIELSDPNNS